MDLFFSEKLIVNNPYDSHVHWAGTGARELSLDLSHLKSPKDFLNQKVYETHFRGEWLVGYNWSQSNWSKIEAPTRLVLDSYSYKGPIILLRADRHAAWVNTVALKVAGLYKKWNSPSEIEGGLIHLDENGFPTGYLIDRAMDIIKSHIQEEKPEQIYHQLKTACQVFNRVGITHIRDLTCHEVQWNQSLKLEKNKELTLCIDQFFDFDGISNLVPTIEFAREAQKENTKYIKVRGVKFYYDGALGSEGALLSSPYYGNTKNYGFALYDKETIKEIIKKVFKENLEVAVHVIGDEAAHQVVTVVSELSEENIIGTVNLEHAEVLRTETIELMKDKNIICHMQPCHWLSDKVWAKEKLNGLFKYIFQWRALESRGIPFYFGSDAPIEPASILRNIEAMYDAELSGISPTSESPIKYIQHKNSWIPNCYSVFEKGRLIETCFNGVQVFTHE